MVTHEYSSFFKIEVAAEEDGVWTTGKVQCLFQGIQSSMTRTVPADSILPNKSQPFSIVWSDNTDSTKVRLGITLVARSVSVEVKVGDMVWMDGAHVPHQVPWKLAPRCFGSYRVRKVKGTVFTLELAETLDKTSDKINIRRLKFFEERDTSFGDYQGPVQPTLDPLGVCRYEIKRFVAHRVFHRWSEYWVQWEGYDAAWDMWVHRDVLVDDVGNGIS
jgi:hypothetical protein